MGNIRIKNDPRIVEVESAAFIIKNKTEFAYKCIPDKKTGGAPYRIGWGRSIGPKNEVLVANKSEENNWLLLELEKTFHSMDRHQSYEEITSFLVSRFLSTH